MKIAVVNLLSYILVVIINGLAILLPFYGNTPGDISDLYNDPLTPADFTFRIWSVIYILLGFFIYHQWFDPKSRDVLGWSFIATCICNMSWLVLWQSHHIGPAFIAIFLLWILLILINYRLTTEGCRDWMIYVPFSVYLGWVSLAALANLNILFLEWGFEFFGFVPETWTGILIGIGVCGGGLVLYLYRNYWFLITLIWGYWGVYSKNADVDHMLPQLILGAMVLLVIMTATAVYQNRNQFSSR